MLNRQETTVLDDTAPKSRYKKKRINIPWASLPEGPGLKCLFKCMWEDRLPKSLTTRDVALIVRHRVPDLAAWMRRYVPEGPDQDYEITNRIAQRIDKGKRESNKFEWPDLKYPSLYPEIRRLVDKAGIITFDLLKSIIQRVPNPKEDPSLRENHTLYVLAFDHRPNWVKIGETSNMKRRMIAHMKTYAEAGPRIVLEITTTKKRACGIERRIIQEFKAQRVRPNYDNELFQVLDPSGFVQYVKDLVTK